jgi:hypothetical protein
VLSRDKRQHPACEGEVFSFTKYPKEKIIPFSGINDCKKKYTVRDQKPMRRYAINMPFGCYYEIIFNNLSNFHEIEDFNGLKITHAQGMK